MYEPIRSKSVHTVTGAPDDFPHRSREEELDIQLAGHLSALLTAVDEIRALAPDAGLDTAAERLAGQVARLRGESAVVRAARPAPERTGAESGTASVPRPGGERGIHTEPGSGAGHPPVRAARLHRRAHALAGRALVVAASRADTAAAILAAECMDLHAAGSGTQPGRPEVAATF
jgi:hypothetical protein